MKHIFFIFLSCLLCSNFTFGQEVIMRQNGSVSVPYYTNTTTLAQVVAAASAGDTIYLPGITFDLGTSPLVINKRLHIIGVGHYLGASNATIQTVIVGAVNILGGANLGDGGSLTGIYFQPHAANTDDFQFGNSGLNQNVTNFTFTRCRISNDLSLTYNTLSSPLASNINFRECVLIYVSGPGNQNIHFDYCIFRKLSSFNNGTVILNNCIGTNNALGGVSATTSLSLCSNLIINNTIICAQDNIAQSGHIFNNCVINSSYNYNVNGANNVILTAIPLNTIFQNVSTSAFGANYFDYTYDYHLAPNSPAYINGVEVGIYGGNTPAKEKGIPFNPHVQNFNINGGTVTVETQAQSY